MRIDTFVQQSGFLEWSAELKLAFLQLVKAAVNFFLVAIAPFIGLIKWLLHWILSLFG